LRRWLLQISEPRTGSLQLIDHSKNPRRSGRIGRRSLIEPSLLIGVHRLGMRLSAAIRALRRPTLPGAARDHQNAFTSLAPLEHRTTVPGRTSNSRCGQTLSGASSRPWTSAGGAVASTAVKASMIVYWCIASAGTNQESPALRLIVCPSRSSLALPEITYPTVS
jgi:hypothetical protein